MNQSYQTSQNSYPSSSNWYQYPNNGNNKSDERLAGGFVFPFLLGGVTGAAISPAFWNNGYGYNRPVYYYPPNIYYPYPPRRWF